MTDSPLDDARDGGGGGGDEVRVELLRLDHGVGRLPAVARVRAGAVVRQLAQVLAAIQIETRISSRSTQRGMQEHKWKQLATWAHQSSLDETKLT